MKNKHYYIPIDLYDIISREALVCRLSPQGGDAMSMYEMLSLIVAILTLVVSIMQLLKK